MKLHFMAFIFKNLQVNAILLKDITKLYKIQNSKHKTIAYYEYISRAILIPIPIPFIIPILTPIPILTISLLHITISTTSHN